MSAGGGLGRGLDKPLPEKFRKFILETMPNFKPKSGEMEIGGPFFRSSRGPEEI